MNDRSLDRNSVPKTVIDQERKRSIRKAMTAANNEALLFASRDGDLERIEKLLKGGADVNYQDNQVGCTALHLAADFGHLDVVSRLLAHPGININVQEGAYGETALHLAASQGRTAVVSKLLEQPLINISIRNKEGKTALKRAEKRRNSDIVELLHRARSRSGGNMAQQIRSAVGAGMDIGMDIGSRISIALQRPGAVNEAMLIAAAGSGNINRVQELLAKPEVNVNYIDDRSGNTALISASGNGHLSVVVLLLAHSQVDVNLTNSIGSTALHCAAFMGETAVVKQLLAHPQVDVLLENNYGATALVLALENQHAEVVEEIQKSCTLQGRTQDEEDIAAAARLGSKEWGRSKILLVGEGRAGKTAVANSIIGKPFIDTPSTIGINQLTCDIKYVSTTTTTTTVNEYNGSTTSTSVTSAEAMATGLRNECCGHWEEYTKPKKELEFALANMIAQHRRNIQQFSTATKAKDTDALLLSRSSGVPNGREDTRRNSIFKWLAKKASKAAAVASDRRRGSKSTSSHATHLNTGGAGAGAGAVLLERRLSNSTVSASMVDHHDYMDFAELEEDYLTTASAASLLADSAHEIDEELVMKCLSNGILTDSKLIISVFDFGGQTVFNVLHHLFLTSTGVYALVFNMEWLVSPDKTVRDRCIRYLNFWLNSVVVHTLNDMQETAPVVFVGTHKDIVSDPMAHQRISTMLYEAFHASIAWPYILENPLVVSRSSSKATSTPATDRREGAGAEAGEASKATSSDRDSYGDTTPQISPPGCSGLAFFPVDNTAGRSDPVMIELLRVIEQTMDASPYVHAKKPLAWLQALDQLTETGKSYLSLHEVEVIANTCGIPAAQVPRMLKFLHEMGVLMWHEEEGLRDVVILDALEYFVAPATIIICKHAPTTEDATHHVRDIHRLCKKRFHRDWELLTEKGIVSHHLLLELLDDFDEHVAKIIQLMIKFGLLVCLDFEEELTSSSSLSDAVYDIAQSSNNNTTTTAAAVAASASASITASTSVTAITTAGSGSEDASPKTAVTMGTSSSFDSVNDLSMTNIRNTTNAVGMSSAVHQAAAVSSKHYLVPALLPRRLNKYSAASGTDGGERWAVDSHNTSTCFLVFSVYPDLQTYAAIAPSDLKTKGFLPRGLAERLIGKAVAWSQHTSATALRLENEPLYRDMIILAFGNQRFRLRVFNELNCIQVDVEGASPLAVLERLLSFSSKIIAECMQSLRCFTALPYHDEAFTGDLNACTSALLNHSFLSDQQEKGGKRHEEGHRLLLPLDSLKGVLQLHSALNREGGRKLLSEIEVKKLYSAWIPDLKLLDRYDCFVSYRWNKYDSDYALALFDTFSNYTVGEDHRGVDVFIDRKRLQDGRSFQFDFANALINSVVVVPILSHDALLKMLDHSGEKEDNVLIEWMLALECYTSPQSRVSKIFPVAFGERELVTSSVSNGAGIKDLFDADSSYHRLPNVIPTASMQRVDTLLRANGINPSVNLARYTVSSIVKELATFLFFKTWEACRPGRVVAEGAERIMSVLRSCDVSEGYSSGGGGGGSSSAGMYATWSAGSFAMSGAGAGAVKRTHDRSHSGNYASSVCTTMKYQQQQQQHTHSPSQLTGIDSGSTSTAAAVASNTASSTAPNAASNALASTCEDVFAGLSLSPTSSSAGTGHLALPVHHPALRTTTGASVSSSGNSAFRPLAEIINDIKTDLGMNDVNDINISFSTVLQNALHHLTAEHQSACDALPTLKFKVHYVAAQFGIPIE